MTARTAIGPGLLALGAFWALSTSAVVAQDPITVTGAQITEGQGTIEYSAQADALGDVDPTTATELFENGTLLPSTVEPLPSDELEIVMVIDTSGSMRENGAIDAARQAALGFVAEMPRGVSIGVVAFNDSASLAAPLSTDRTATNAAISGLRANGETALYDAVVFAQSLFSGGSTDRQILLLSDGGDTVSRNTIDDALSVSSQIRTSVIELVSSEANADALRRLAEANDGTVSSAADPEALESLYADAAAQLLNRYRVRFTPTVTGDVTYTIRLATPDGPLEASSVVEVAQLAPATTVPVTTIPPTTTSTTTTTIVNTIVPNLGVADSAPPSSSTWLLIAGGVAVFVALLVLGLVAFASRRARTTALRAPTMAVPDTGSRKDRAIDRATGVADAVLERSDRAEGLARRLETAGVSLRAGEFSVVVFVLGLVATLLLVALLTPILGLLIGVLVTPLAATAYLDNRSRKRRIAFGEQLPDVLQLITSSLRSGFGLPQALDSAAQQSSEPMKTELQRVLFEVRIGRNLTESLYATADRMESRDFRWVAGAIQINREVGGELAGVLDNVGETIRGRQRLARQVRVLTAEGRYSAYVLILQPILLAAFLLIRQPDYFASFRSGVGLALSIGSVLLMVIGWVWMKALINKEY